MTKSVQPIDERIEKGVIVVYLVFYTQVCEDY